MPTLVPPDPRESSQPEAAPSNNPAQAGEESKQRDEQGRFAEGNTLSLGRIPGIPNMATRALRAVARWLTLEDDKVILRLHAECQNGKIDPMIFRELLHYAYGKPPDKLIVDDRRPPFTVLMRKMVEPIREERQPVDTPPTAEPPPAGLPATPEPRPGRRPRQKLAPTDPEAEGNGGGVIWGD